MVELKGDRDRTAVYILCFPHDKRYVGITWNPEIRLKSHARGKGPSAKWIRKHGLPKMVVVGWFGRLEAESIEKYLIERLGSLYPGGWNLVEGGLSGRRASETTRRRISRIQTGRKLSEETKARMRVSHKNRKPISEETRRRISVSAKRRGVAPEVVAALVKARPNQTFSKETRQKLSVAGKRQWARRKEVL